MTYTAPQMTELEELECIYCEMHKDVYGVKARWYRAESVEQARKDLEQLSKEAEVAAQEEKARGQQALAKLEARIADTIKMGAATRENALRWIMQAEGETDKGMLEYTLGIPYGSFK